MECSNPKWRNNHFGIRYNMDRRQIKDFVKRDGPALHFLIDTKEMLWDVHRSVPAALRPKGPAEPGESGIEYTPDAPQSF